MALFLREAKMEDAQDILNWRNDKTTRENSFSSKEISLLTHMNWFKRKMSDRDCLLFILMEDDKKVGHIRVDISGNEGEISYMIAPDYRKKGYGKKIIALVEGVVPDRVKTLKGLTLKENVASGKCFEANGYTAGEMESSFCYLKNIR